VLNGDGGEQCRELLREIALSQEVTIYPAAVNRDHVHMLMGIPPNLSVSKAAQGLRGKSSHKLLSEFAALRKKCWGQHLRGPGNWAAAYAAHPRPLFENAVNNIIERRGRHGPARYDLMGAFSLRKQGIAGQFLPRGTPDEGISEHSAFSIYGFTTRGIG
jgi:REP element-mobilizing transposase RayT